MSTLPAHLSGQEQRQAKLSAWMLNLWKAYPFCYPDRTQPVILSAAKDLRAGYPCRAKEILRCAQDDSIGSIKTAEGCGLGQKREISSDSLISLLRSAPDTIMAGKKCSNVVFHL